MKTEEFNARLSEIQKLTVNVLTEKAKEYAADDRLHNFKAAAALQRETPVKTLGGMMVKHTVSLYDLIHDMEAGFDVPMELWQKKIIDNINYLYLLWALLNEKVEDNNPYGY